MSYLATIRHGGNLRCLFHTVETAAENLTLRLVLLSPTFFLCQYFIYSEAHTVSLVGTRYWH